MSTNITLVVVNTLLQVLIKINYKLIFEHDVRYRMLCVFNTCI